MTLSLLATGHYFILDFYSNAYCIAVYCIVNRCFNMSFQQFHYPVGVDHSLPCSQARVIPDNYGFVSQLQTLELHLDTSVRLCRGSVASAHDVFESSSNPVVHSHVMKVHYFSANILFVSLFRHCSLWFFILLALVIYVVFLKRMKHRSGSSVKIKVCGLELF